MGYHEGAMVSYGSRCCVLAAAVFGCLGLGGLSIGRADAQPAIAENAQPQVRVLRNLAYVASGFTGGFTGVDRQQALDLYLPAAKATPLFVYIHGGAWVGGDKSQYATLGLTLAAQGVAVAIINYRLSGDGLDGVRHPAHAQDAAAAVAWLRKRTGLYGYDGSHIFVGGHSAGAHISALLAYDSGLLAAVGERPESLRGFIGLEGIYDLNDLVRRFPSYRVDFVQLAFGVDETLWRTASPQRLVSGSLSHHLPWLIVHSREDELVDLEQSRRFRAALEKQNVPVRWLSPERGSHFGVIEALTNPQSPICQQLLAFLRS